MKVFHWSCVAAGGLGPTTHYAEDYQITHLHRPERFIATYAPTVRFFKRSVRIGAFKTFAKAKAAVEEFRRGSYYVHPFLKEGTWAWGVFHTNNPEAEAVASYRFRAHALADSKERNRSSKSRPLAVERP